MRKPTVENRYRLTIQKIRQLVVADRSLVCEPLFWRNDVVGSWCISKVAEPSKYGDETSYWIGIYDEDAKSYAGQFRFYFSTYGGMCGYDFTHFFDASEIENEWDLIIQEKFLTTINELIDAGVLKFPDKL